MNKYITTKQLATILAALRLFQTTQEEHNMENLLPDYFDFEDPLTKSEIDELCEIINMNNLVIEE